MKQSFVQNLSHPIAIIDIGSNSVRLVVYENMTRTPSILFNEKIIGELGKGLEKTGFLPEDSVKLVLRALTRFRMLIDQLMAKSVHAFATSAVRDAKNRDDFMQAAQEILQTPIILLSGEEEAYYSALGILSGFYQPCGIVGDLGGGSLELITVKDQKLGRGVSFPLGGLRLKDRADEKLSQARDIVENELKESAFFTEAAQYKGENFYAIGGVWRSIAQLYMYSKGYPLHIMHHFTIPLEDCRRFLQRIARGDVDHLRGIEEIAKNRRYLLAYGAIVLLEILNLLTPRKIIFSVQGVRDGYLYSLLSSQEKQKDPLLFFADKMANLYARSLSHAYELAAWTENAFSALKLLEEDQEKRCREAVCLMSDIGWRAAEDYRGTQAFDMIAYGVFFGVSHAERLFIALSVYYRSAVSFSDTHVVELAPLIPASLHKKARILGVLLDIAALLSAFHTGIIESLVWQQESEGTALLIPKKYTRLIGDRLEKRLAKLEELLGEHIYFKVIDD